MKKRESLFQKVRKQAMAKVQSRIIERQREEIHKLKKQVSTLKQSK